ncbi:DUF4276 family protein [uncultured Thiodictyon sp.]|uniref:DUF4276 family protein n=1 Tax=uncultured Thiodictyon sp. TaxID=1846217 RepID=UPI0025CD0264|nr:DUF4276 family protein [uncultured Thiodictyon sp.]
MVAITVFVEGGGDTNDLRTACRRAFKTFLTEAGVTGPHTINARGSRGKAYESFCIAIAQGVPALLLVDSEALVSAAHQSGEDKSQWKPWEHLRQRDNWSKPKGATDTDCHLMVVCMESWLIADRQRLQAFFGQGFKLNALPKQSRSIEGIDKEALYKSLKTATAHCKTKTEYGKGEHSFTLLRSIDPVKVTGASRWAERFIDELKRRMGILSGPSEEQVVTWSQLTADQQGLLTKMTAAHAITELMDLTAASVKRTEFRDQCLTPLLEQGLVTMTIPDKPQSSKQRYRLTERGSALLAGQQTKDKMPHERPV